MKPVFLDTILDPKNNNFALARLLAAMGVLVSHALLLQSGDASREILAGQTFYNLGEHAVNVFFVLSGIMVSASLARSPSLTDFAVARVLRIFPALIACTFVIAFVIGPLVTVLPIDAYVSKSLLRYLLQTVSVTSGAADLPGVFVNNPFPSVIDAPIWTLKYEIACYVLLAMLHHGRCLESTARFTALIAVTWIAGMILLVADFTFTPAPLDHLARFWLCFSFGMVLYRLRARIPLSIVLVAAFGLAWWLARGSALERIVSLLATGYAAIWFASLPMGPLRTLTNRMDLSYGIYIFGWPITQTLIWLSPGLPILPLEAEAIVITVAVATLSWIAIEKPALARRGRIAEVLRSWRDWTAWASSSRRPG